MPRRRAGKESGSKEVHHHHHHHHHHETKRNGKRSKCTCLRAFLIILATVYVACLLGIKFSRTIQDGVVYLHWLNLPFFHNLSNPDEFYGLEKARSFHLPLASGKGHIGVWHILPNDPYRSMSAPQTDKQFDDALANGQPVIMYMHGNLGSRGTYHRIRLYQLLSSLGSHVLSLDYQGFGDSTGWPTESGMADDGRVVWEWARERIRRKGGPTYIWGHSLGSAGATLLSKQLCETGSSSLSGLILEAPITNIIDAAMSHPFSYPFRYLPFFRDYVIGSLPEKFDSLSRISNLTCPILVLHGSRDQVVPIDHGHKIHEEGVRTGRSITFHEFPDAGHKTIKDDPNVETILRHFFDLTKPKID
ncbi:lysophosphatidylserine lipase ABHD12-like [Oscarella lobularis]|uniref:lysophosphatidylserine lipase ABHD12-like n=1 Tax=Oscarella lobularis TaxID=121494 RepID=UPI0033133916